MEYVHLQDCPGKLCRRSGQEVPAGSWCSGSLHFLEESHKITQDSAGIPPAINNLQLRGWDCEQTAFSRKIPRINTPHSSP